MLATVAPVAALFVVFEAFWWLNGASPSRDGSLATARISVACSCGPFAMRWAQAAFGDQPWLLIVPVASWGIYLATVSRLAKQFHWGWFALASALWHAAGVVDLVQSFGAY